MAAQGAGWDTDHALEGFAIAVKPSDSRAKSYIESYGDQCWEADVLPAEVIVDAINTDIMSWLNRKLWKQREAVIERAPVPFQAFAHKLHPRSRHRVHRRERRCRR